MIPAEALPGPAARAEQFARASEALVDAGYVPIGLDHFALPEDSLAVAARTGRLHRNFQGYTADPARTLIAVGTSAIGRTERQDDVLPFVKGVKTQRTRRTEATDETRIKHGYEQGRRVGLRVSSVFIHGYFPSLPPRLSAFA